MNPILGRYQEALINAWGKEVSFLEEAHEANLKAPVMKKSDVASSTFPGGG